MGKVTQEPVAWLYERSAPFPARYIHAERHPAYLNSPGWAETPLHAQPVAHAELVEAAKMALAALEGTDRLLHANGMMAGVSCPAIEPLRKALSLYGGEKP